MTITQRDIQRKISQSQYSKSDIPKARFLWESWTLERGPLHLGRDIEGQVVRWLNQYGWWLTPKLYLLFCQHVVFDRRKAWSIFYVFQQKASNFHSPGQMRLQPDVMSFSSLILACGEGMPWGSGRILFWQVISSAGEMVAGAPCRCTVAASNGRFVSLTQKGWLRPKGCEERVSNWRSYCTYSVNMQMVIES